jgi:hypothetical protein
MCDAQKFGYNFLHGSPKILILDALESRLNGALEYPIFPFFTSLNMCSILMKTAVLFRDFGGVDDLDFSFYYELMGVIRHACKITIMHKVPPR